MFQEGGKQSSVSSSINNFHLFFIGHCEIEKNKRTVLNILNAVIKNLGVPITNELLFFVLEKIRQL